MNDAIIIMFHNKVNFLIGDSYSLYEAACMIVKCNNRIICENVVYPGQDAIVLIEDSAGTEFNYVPGNTYFIGYVTDKGRFGYDNLIFLDNHSLKSFAERCKNKITSRPVFSRGVWNVERREFVELGNLLCNIRN